MSYYTSLRLQGIVTKEYMDRWMKAADIIGIDITNLYIEDYKEDYEDGEDDEDPQFTHMKLSIPILYKLPNLKTFQLSGRGIIHSSVIEDLIEWTSDMNNTNPHITTMILSFSIKIGQFFTLLKSLHGNTTLSSMGISSLRILNEKGVILSYSMDSVNERIINHISEYILSSHIKRIGLPPQLDYDHCGSAIAKCLSTPIEKRSIPYMGKTKSAMKTS